MVLVFFTKRDGFSLGRRLISQRLAIIKAYLVLLSVTECCSRPSVSCVQVRVPTHQDGSCLFWEFATDAYDIGFGLFFEWTADDTDAAVTVHVTDSDEDDEDEDDGDDTEDNDFDGQ